MLMTQDVMGLFPAPAHIPFFSVGILTVQELIYVVVDNCNTFGCKTV